MKNSVVIFFFFVAIKSGVIETYDSPPYDHVCKACPKWWLRAPNARVDDFFMSCLGSMRILSFSFEHKPVQTGEVLSRRQFSKSSIWLRTPEILYWYLLSLTTCQTFHLCMIYYILDWSRSNFIISKFPTKTNFISETSSLKSTFDGFILNMYSKD